LEVGAADKPGAVQFLECLGYNLRWMRGPAANEANM